MLKDLSIFLHCLVFLFLISGCTSIEKAESLYHEGDQQSALEMAVSLMEEEEVSEDMRHAKEVGMEVDLIYKEILMVVVTQLLLKGMPQAVTLEVG